ncbi:cysteine rich repeat-containing protein [Methylocystis sp. IM3]|jgi:hypothetical protein|uniref:cysteine rich repeat-containing protein n=1 Tax=unclassified Methylocystis TaxID=2625913 RepID=UPI000FABEEF2|nr:MAG: hypothetical protein EKK29_09620 [Hyphomicrobiales bacterium]
MPARRFALALLSFAVIVVAQPAAAFDEAVLAYCKSDIERLCAGIQPGGGRLLQCLKGHKEEMSVGCAQGLAKMKKGR